MEKINVTFKGMANIPDEQVAQDGQMAMMMNVSIKNGEMVVMNGHNYFYVRDDVKKAVFHDGRLLEIDENGAVRVFVEKDGKPAYEQTEYDEEMSEAFKDVEVDNFEIMGNVVVMYGKEKNREIEGTFYAIWKNERYLYLGGIRDLVRVRFRKEAKLFKSIPSENITIDKKTAAGYIDRTLNTVYSEGYFVDRVVMRYAYRLFDGSYICPSGCYLLENKEGFKEDGGSVFLGIDTNNLVADVYAAYVNAFKVECDVEFIDGTEDWKDIIVGVDVFCTGSIMGKKKVERLEEDNSGSTETVSTLKGGAMVTMWKDKDRVDIVNEIVNSGIFYRFASFDLEGLRLDSTENTSPSGLAQRDVLKEWNRHEDDYGKTFVYNAKLHGARKGKLLFEGYDDFLVPGTETGVITNDEMVETPFAVKGDLEVQVTLNTDDGEKVVRMYKENSVLAKTKGGCLLPGLLMYPDPRAVKMELLWEKYDGGIYYAQYPLVPNMDNNFAYYLEVKEQDNKEGSYAVSRFSFVNNVGEFRVVNSEKLVAKIKSLFGSIHAEDEGFYAISAGQFNWVAVAYLKKDQEGSVKPMPEATLQSYDFNDKGYNYGVYLKPKKSYYLGADREAIVYLFFKKLVSGEVVVSDIVFNNIDNEKVLTRSTVRGYEVFKPDTMRVSAVDNPFYFPTAQTYQFDGDIVAMASNAEAISQGQFGQFPLFVFTTQGVWAMQVDTTGKTAYSTQTLFCRDVATGEAASLGRGVVFTTERGVMMIEGGQLKEISKDLDGDAAQMFKHSENLIGQIYRLFDHGALKNVEPKPIREFVKNAVLGYDYKGNRLFLGSKKASYSYVYDIDTQTWGMDKTGYITCKVDNTGPQGELVMYNGGNTRMIIASENINREIMAITRPMKAGTLTFKRLRQAALRTTFKGALNFYVLGSNDGATFSVITGKEYPSKNGNEPTDVTRRDLITAMSRSRQYKYFAIAIAGNMEGRISMAELLVDEGLAINKLR